MDAWEDLVYDDDVFESFLKKCDGFAFLIPGLAGNVQVALLNRTITGNPKSTQEFAADVAHATFERDFNCNAWKWAEMFIQHHELVKEGKMENMSNLKEAKSGKVLPFVACLLKEFKSNGLGDMQLTLKVQCFSPNRATHYLNIVHRNVVKVFPADICPPTIELVQQTPKPTIRLPMWGEKLSWVNELLSKFLPPLTEQPSSSVPKQPEQPSSSVPPPTEQPLSFVPPPTEQPSSSVPPPTEQPSSSVPPSTEQPSSSTEENNN